jgi:CheY-like chemotaxis protein
LRACEIAERRAPTPIVMLSANAMPEHVAAARAAGCDLHLSKPIAPDRLRRLLDWAQKIEASA